MTKINISDLREKKTKVVCDTICRPPIRLTGFLWGQMKPFIRGKILFSPDTPSTRRIMAAVNATFSPIEGVRRMTRKWIEVYSERVRGLFLDKENQEFLKVTIL